MKTYLALDLECRYIRMRSSTKIFAVCCLFWFSLTHVMAHGPFECERGSNRTGRIYALSFGTYKTGDEAKKDFDQVNMTVRTVIDKKKSFISDIKLVIIEDTKKNTFHVVDSTCYTNRAPLGEASSMAFLLKSKYGLSTSYFEVHGKNEFIVHPECD